jgi:hypothetical protein
MKHSKYRNVPTVVDGVRFASKAEAKRDAELQLLVRAGEIVDLQRQPKFDLFVGGKKICRYVGDWSYWESDPTRDHRSLIQIVEDRKGALTPAFKIKWALAKALHPEIEWRLS